MKAHVFRPLYVILGFIAIILIARMFVVPDDFGSHEAGYMYGWHRKGNEQEWKDFKVKYKGREYCKDCHYDMYEMVSQTPHVIIQCENCHGPAIDHPAEPPKLQIIKSRELCLRCHAYLPYDQSGRAWIRQIENNEHNPEIDCVVCHNPHKPGFN